MGTLQSNNIFADHYLLKERLSKSPVSEVWKAEDWTADGTTIVIKIFVPETKLDSYTLDLLGKEWDQLQYLKHPHLLQPFRSDTYQGIPYLVMPFMSQGSLSQKLIEYGPFSEANIAMLIQQVGSALAYLHTQQPPVLHRQITADNILIADNGDYILAAPVLSAQLRNALHKATGHQPMMQAAYAAPELFSAHPVQHEAGDIFSLGVTLYELCTGELPWLGNGGLSLQKGAEVPYLPAPYTRIMSNLVRACLQPDWEKRPSAEQLVEEANYYLENDNWKPYGLFGNVTAETIVYIEKSSLIPVLLITLLVCTAMAAAYFFYFKNKASSDDGFATVENMAENPGQVADDTITQVPPLTQNDSLTPQVKNARQEKQAATNTPRTAAPAPVKQTETAPRPAAPRQTAYPRPKNLEGYLNALLDEEIPLNLKDQWRPAIRKNFTSDAIVYAQMNDSPLGSFGVAEFLDILQSSEAGSSIRIDKIIRDEQNEKIEEINVSLYSGK